MFGIVFSEHVLHTLAKCTRMTKEEVASYVHDDKCVAVGSGRGQMTSSLLLFSHKDNRHFVISYRSSSKTILDIIPADKYREFTISIESAREAERLAFEEVHICGPGLVCCGDRGLVLNIQVKFIVRNLKSDRSYDLYWKCKDPVLNALGRNFPIDDRAHKKIIEFAGLNIRGDETCDATYYRIGKGPFVAFTVRGL